MDLLNLLVGMFLLVALANVYSTGSCIGCGKMLQHAKDCPNNRR